MQNLTKKIWNRINKMMNKLSQFSSWKLWKILLFFNNNLMKIKKNTLKKMLAKFIVNIVMKSQIWKITLNIKNQYIIFEKEIIKEEEKEKIK